MLIKVLLFFAFLLIWFLGGIIAIGINNSFHDKNDKKNFLEKKMMVFGLIIPIILLLVLIFDLIKKIGLFLNKQIDWIVRGFRD